MSKEGETRERVYDFIVAYKLEHQGNTPSLLVISDECGLSGKSHAKHHLEKLVDDGLIIRSDDGREIEVIGAEWVFEREGE